MTSNILHHLRELQVAWRRQDFSFTPKQQEEYDKANGKNQKLTPPTKNPVFQPDITTRASKK